MPAQIYSENIKKILLNKKQIELSLNVGLEGKSGIITIIGKPEDEIIALKVIEAINLGFSISQALELKNENFILQKMSIKSIARRKNMSQVRGRIIGTERKVLRTIEFLTNTEIVLHDNTAGIIGQFKDVEIAATAIRKLAAGSEHSNVYRYLEEQRASQGF